MELNKYKKSISLDDFVKLINDDSVNKYDYSVNSTQLKMDVKGNLITKPFKDSKGFSLGFDDLALGQMCQKIDAKELYLYGKSLYEKGQTARLSSLFNYHLDEFNQKGGKDLWVRSKNETCRAVLTDKYGIYDNDFVSSVIYDNFHNRNIDVVGYYVSDSSMHCRIRLLDYVLDAGKNNEDPLYMSIHIQNSEVGLSSLNTSLIIYRQVCTNGLVLEQSNKIFKQKHIGKGFDNKEDIRNKFSLALEYAEEIGLGVLEEFSETQEEVIDMPLENIHFLSRSQGYSQKFTESVEQNFLEEKNNTRYGLINAFTAAARDLDREKRLEVERFAGNLIYKQLLTTK